MVSVIIPLYNKERHIKRAIESVLGQTVCDYELIVVDDGSTDSSPQIVRQCRDPRIRILTQENRGVSAARNSGAAESKYDLIAFLDADDIWDADFLQTVLALHDRFPEAAVWATARRELHADRGLVHPVYHGRLPEKEEAGLIDYFWVPNGDCPLCSSSVLLKKNALTEVGGFPVGYVYSEDHDTWLRLALHFQIAWTSKEKVTYDQTATNRSAEYWHVGIYPFFASLNRFKEQNGPENKLPKNIDKLLASRHATLFLPNWLAGDRKAIWAIAKDCIRVRGYRLKSVLWFMLSMVPQPFVAIIYQVRRYCAKKNTMLPEFRKIYRDHNNPKS